MLALADVAIVVSDAQKTADWWTQKLGFATKTIGEPGGHALMVAPPGERFVLHLCEGFDRVEPGNTGIAFITDDIDGTVRRMTEAGVEFPEPLRETSWGGVAKFADPDGNVFWLLAAPAGMIRETVRARAPTGRSRSTPRARPRSADRRKSKRRR
jgi:catechol 2,3-dioxygenase-like lactoylglutathione lyase family enzyme